MSITTPLPAQKRGVGQRLTKLDAVPKVSGQFAYASDLHEEGMLFLATARSPHPHATIRSIDTRRARAFEGVHAVLTAEDVPGRPTFGVEVADQPVLATDRVRYVGEPIAIVAATDMDTARAAAAAVDVEYDLLQTIADPFVALQSAPLHDTPPDNPGWSPDARSNVIRTVRIAHGDLHARGEVVVAHRYELGRQDPAFLGPEAGLAIPDGSGGVDIHVATQWLHQDLHQVVACLGLDEQRVRIHLAGVGGAFGGREDLSGQVHASMLALRTGRPVKFAYLRDESFIGHVHRHPAWIDAELHATARGEIVFVKMRIVLDGGAYASGSPAVTFNAATMACGPYRVPNADLEATTVYTNNPPAGAMRGFGVVQVCHAHEAQMDALAAAVGTDPVSIRTLNALHIGDVLPTGERLTEELPVTETIERCAELVAPDAETVPRAPIRLPGGVGNTTRGEGVRRGSGFAAAYKNVAYSAGYDDYATARVRLLTGEDGLTRAEVHSAAVEFGQGLTNVHTQVIGEELDVDEVILLTPTTAGPGSAGSTSASRQTWMTAGALRLCCAEIKRLLADSGGSVDPAKPLDVTQTYHHPKTSPLDPDTGQVQGDRAHMAYGTVAMRAEVEVDVELGLVRVVWIGIAQDVGKALNPTLLEGQIEGGVVQGLGLAVMEELETADGLVRNASFTDYLIPTILDVPPIDIALLEIPHPSSPYGLKGVGEAPAIVATAAVAAAIRDATGLPISRVPVALGDIAGLSPHTDSNLENATHD